MDQHAVAVNVLYLPVAHLGSAHACRVDRHKHGAMEQIAGGVDQSYHFVLSENRRQAPWGFRIRHFLDWVGALQRLAEEETQSGGMVSDRPRVQLSFGEQVYLIGTDLVRSKLIRSTAKILGEGLHNLQVALHGSLRVITTLEIFQHLFAKLGHRDLLVTHTLRPQSRKVLTCDTRSVRRAGGFVQTPFRPPMIALSVSSATSTKLGCHYLGARGVRPHLKFNGRAAAETIAADFKSGRAAGRSTRALPVPGRRTTRP
jgi:hypothetical protein